MTGGDPYVYQGTNVLRNKLGIRDYDELEQAERLLTLQRMREGVPALELSPAGYRTLHRHLFQDLYDWAGQTRTVDISKCNSLFCLAQHVDAQLAQRLGLLRKERGLRGSTAEHFADRVAEHVSELNAIHPFREGNGRTMRAFLQQLARQAGHTLDLTRILPRPWNQASIDGFGKGDYGPMREVIAGAITGRGPDISRKRGESRSR